MCGCSTIYLFAHIWREICRRVDDFCVSAPNVSQRPREPLVMVGSLRYYYFILAHGRSFVPFPFFWNLLSCLLSPFPPFIFVIISNFLHVPFPSFVLIRKYTHILVVSRSLFVSTFLLHYILLLLSFRDLVDVVKTASSYRWTQVFLNFSLILLLFCRVLFARYCVMWLPMNNTYININVYNDICKWLCLLKIK